MTPLLEIFGHISLNLPPLISILDFFKIQSSRTHSELKKLHQPLNNLPQSAVKILASPIKLRDHKKNVKRPALDLTKKIDSPRPTFSTLEKSASVGAFPPPAPFSPAPPQKNLSCPSRTQSILERDRPRKKRRYSRLPPQTADGVTAPESRTPRTLTLFFFGASRRDGIAGI